jgi:hypothetical protein
LSLGDVSALEIRKLARRKMRRYRFDTDAPATENELKNLFQSTSSQLGSKGMLNAIQLSTIWRLVTGEKGNLFKEMKLFQKFDRNNNGYLGEDDFVYGWFLVANEPGREDLLRKLRSLAEEQEDEAEDFEQEPSNEDMKDASTTTTG